MTLPSGIPVSDQQTRPPLLPHLPPYSQPPLNILFIFLLSLKDGCPLRILLCLVPSQILACFFFLTPQFYWPGVGVDILFLLLVASSLLEKPSLKHKSGVTPATQSWSSHNLFSWSPALHQPPTLPDHSLKILIYHCLSLHHSCHHSWWFQYLYIVLHWSRSSCRFYRFQPKVWCIECSCLSVPWWPSQPFSRGVLREK